MYSATSGNRPLTSTSIVSSSPTMVLTQRRGTNPRFANSSSTRGITPGSTPARIEKAKTPTAGSASEGGAESAAAAATDDMDGVFLNTGETANSNDPILYQDRVANSPAEPVAEGPHVHPRTVSSPPGSVKLEQPERLGRAGRRR